MKQQNIKTIQFGLKTALYYTFQVSLNIKSLHNVKGAVKLYFLHYLCVVSSLLNTCLDKSGFSTYSFEKIVFRLSAFSVCSVFQFQFDKLYNIYKLVVFFILTLYKPSCNNKYCVKNKQVSREV